MFKIRVGLYKVENINNTKILTIIVTPKEYFEMYRDCSINIKHMGLKKNIPGIDSEAYLEILTTLMNIVFRVNKKKGGKKVSDNKWFLANKIVKKTQFAGLNDTNVFIFTMG